MQQQLDRAPLGNESAGHDSHRETGRKEQQHRNSGAHNPGVQGDDKTFASLRAKLGMRGFTLARTHSRDGAVEYVVGFRGHHKCLRTLAAAEAFARQVGALK